MDLAGTLPFEIDEQMILRAKINDTAMTLSQHYERTNNPLLIAKAIQFLEAAVAHSPAGAWDLPFTLCNLGNCLSLRFERTGDVADITEAIVVQRKAVALTPDDDPGLAGRFTNLGVSLLCSSKRSGDLAELDESITCHRKAVELSPAPSSSDNDPITAILANEAVMIYSNLGNSLRNRFERTSDPADLDEAIAAQRQGLTLTPPSHPFYPSALNNLGNSFVSRFKTSGDVADIGEAIAHHQRAVQHTPAGHAQLPMWLSTLGGSFQTRFDQTNNPDDIAEAIQVLQRSVDLTSEGDAELGNRVGHLGSCYIGRFQLTNDRADLDKGVAMHQRAVDLTPPDHAGLVYALNNLGTSLFRRYEHADDVDDVSNAIVALQRALSLMPLDHAHRPACLSNIGRAFFMLYSRTKRPDLVDSAIKAHDEALQGTPPSHAMWPTRLRSKADSYYYRYVDTRNPSDLATSISSYRLAATGGVGSPKDRLGAAENWARILNLWDPSSPDVLVAFGTAIDLLTLVAGLDETLSRRYAQLKEWTTIAVQAAAAACRLGQPEKALEWLEQGRCVVWSQVGRLKVERTLEDLGALGHGELAGRIREVAAKLQGAVGGSSSMSSSITDLSAGLEGMSLESSLTSSSSSSTSASSSSSATTGSRPTSTATVPTNASVAPATSTSASTSTPVPALPLLERKITLEDEARSYIALAREWDDLLRDVRVIPGFEDFLLPATYADIVKDLPKEGPVVVVNVEKERCDAVGLVRGAMGYVELVHVHLAEFSLEKAELYRKMLGSALYTRGLRLRGDAETRVDADAERVARNEDADENDDHSEGERAMKPYGKVKTPPAKKKDPVVAAVLACLWLEVVKPILEALGINKADPSSATPLPRIWWCPTGALSFLPLHAAGIYLGGDEINESIFDYAVSSYTPTISALTSRVHLQLSPAASPSSKPDKPQSQPGGLFLTAHPHPASAPSIPETTTEVQAILSLADARGIGRVLKIEGDDLSVEECLQYMLGRGYGSVHLACHAVQSAADPLESRFMLHKGNMSVRDVIMGARDVEGAESVGSSDDTHRDLAFLSACQTSAGEETLADEAVHLAAGMLAAGYQRVVATMWSIKDEQAPRVARDFYGWLWRDSGEEGNADAEVPGVGVAFDGAGSAYALHHAIQELRTRLGRDEFGDSVLLTWVPYAHFGY